MIPVGKWRWPLVVVLPLVVGSLLFWRGIGHLRYEGSTILTYSGDSKQIDQELKIFRSDNIRRRIDMVLLQSARPLAYEKVLGHPLQVLIKGEADWPKSVVQVLTVAGKICIEQSLANRKTDLHKEIEGFQKRQLNLQAQLDPLLLERKTMMSSPHISIPKSDVTARIRALQSRRQQLIENFPTHTDIALLAEQIKELQAQKHPHSSNVSSKLVDLDRRINEIKYRIDYFARLMQEQSLAERTLKPDWQAPPMIPLPSRPIGMEQWPLFSGMVAGTFLLGWVLLKRGSLTQQDASPNGLWRPETVAADPKPEVAAENPIDLKVVPAEPQLPSDPLTEKAALIYAKWIEVAKVLYAPAPEPPQGILDSVGPLLQESCEFLPEGHDVMARYLARTVAPGDLPAHVARTVLMTLTGAEEAGASSEHRLAMALAALFHDLAMVPRPAPQQDEVGSEVGRLSASVLRRISGLQPDILLMVEDILIGMDEFKLETWHNAAIGRNLEPLSKVLREIDRFEKVMQKQRARLDRQISHRKAV